MTIGTLPPLNRARGHHHSMTCETLLALHPVRGPMTVDRMVEEVMSWIRTIKHVSHPVLYDVTVMVTQLDLRTQVGFLISAWYMDTFEN